MKNNFLKNSFEMIMFKLRRHDKTWKILSDKQKIALNENNYLFNKGKPFDRIYFF